MIKKMNTFASSMLRPDRWALQTGLGVSPYGAPSRGEVGEVLPVEGLHEGDVGELVQVRLEVNCPDDPPPRGREWSPPTGAPRPRPRARPPSPHRAPRSGSRACSRAAAGRGRRARAARGERLETGELVQVRLEVNGGARLRGEEGNGHRRRVRLEHEHEHDNLPTAGLRGAARGAASSAPCGSR